MQLAHGQDRGMRLAAVHGMRRAITLSFASLCVSVAIACAPEREFDREGAPSVDPTPIAIADVLEHPESYAGQQITLGGQIVNVWSERVFSVTGRQFLENDQLLVVSRSNGSADPAGVEDRGAHVRITGTLRTSSDTQPRDLNADLNGVPERLRLPLFVADSVSIEAPLPSR